MLWALWHLPTAWFGGAPDAIGFALYALQVIAFGMVMCWLFDRSGRRTLSAVLAHIGLNLGLVHLPDTAFANGVKLALVVSAGLAAAFALTRERPARASS